MELNTEQYQTLRQLYFAKGDVIQTLIADRLIARGVAEIEAREAARRCSNRIWQNSMATGAVSTLLLGTLFTPVVGGIAGSSLAAAVGIHTLLTSEACRDVRDSDIYRAVDEVNSGY